MSLFEIATKIRSQHQTLDVARAIRAYIASGDSVCEPYDPESGSNTIFHLCLECQRYDVLHFLVNDLKFDINMGDNFEDKLLYYAINVGILEGLEVLSELGARFDIVCAEGRTLMHHAAYHGRYHLMSYLISRGVGLSNEDSLGDTPLHLAAFVGNFDSVKFLIENGANISSKNYTNYTPLDCCLEGLNQRKDFREFHIQSMIYLTKHIIGSGQESLITYPDEILGYIPSDFEDAGLLFTLGSLIAKE